MGTEILEIEGHVYFGIPEISAFEASTGRFATAHGNVFELANNNGTWIVKDQLATEHPVQYYSELYFGAGMAYSPNRKRLYIGGPGNGNSGNTGRVFVFE